MKIKLIAMVIALMVLMVAVSVAAAHDNTHTQGQLEDAGWTCGPPFAPPGHCFPPRATVNNANITVKVFDEAGHFLGTEILWRADLYAEQGCPQDSILALDLNEDGIIDFYACHRYDTGE